RAPRSEGRAGRQDAQHAPSVAIRAHAPPTGPGRWPALPRHHGTIPSSSARRDLTAPPPTPRTVPTTDSNPPPAPPPPPYNPDPIEDPPKTGIGFTPMPRRAPPFSPPAPD